MMPSWRWQAATAALLLAGSRGNAFAALPTIAIIMTGDPDHYHRMAFKRRGGYLEPVANRSSKFRESVDHLVAFARPSLFVFWQKECSEWSLCPGMKAHQNGTVSPPPYPVVYK